jgi:hypothetical protein
MLPDRLSSQMFKAAQSGESGCSANFTPNSVSASSIAETMQAAAGMLPPCYAWGGYGSTK